MSGISNKKHLNPLHDDSELIADPAEESGVLCMSLVWAIESKATINKQRPQNGHVVSKGALFQRDKLEENQDLNCSEFERGGAGHVSLFLGE